MRKMALKIAVFLCLALMAALCGCVEYIDDKVSFDPSPPETPKTSPDTPKVPNVPDIPNTPNMPASYVPDVPSNLRLVDYSIEKANISWDIVYVVNGYKVYRSDSAEGEYQEVDEIRDNAYSIQGLAKKTPYYYKVSAFYVNYYSHERTESELSEYLEIIMPDLRYPPDSVMVTLENSNNILVSWHTDYDDVQYNVYRNSVLVGTTSDLFYQDTGLSFGAVYKYTVTIVTDDGEGPQSLLPGASIKTLPKTPIVINAEALRLTDSSAIRVSWELSPGTNSYNVYRSNSADGPYTPIAKELYYGLPQYIDDKFTRSVLCYYKVSAVNESGETELSEYAAAIVWAAPKNLKAEFMAINVSEDTGFINIRWSEYSDAAVTEYNLYRSTDSKTYTCVGTLSTNGWNDTGVEKNARYYYRVAAVVDGVESEQSPPVNAVARTSLNYAPGDLKYTYTPLIGITLSWNKVENADRYRIYRNGSLLTTTSATFYIDGSMLGTRDYQYYVVALNAAGESPQSRTVYYSAKN